MKTIIATAYAINPYKGSEDGMGWNFILQIARYNKVIAITRENNKTHIESYIAEHPDERYQHITFLYFDLPYWMRFWKAGGTFAMPYYLLWQWSVVFFIKSKQLHYDIVHNLNFHNDWTPSFLWKLNKPFVWGAVGHHSLIAARYLKCYGVKYWIKDRLTWMVKKYFWHVSPALRRTKQRADHIICMNSCVPQVLGLEGKYSIMPSVATQDFGWIEQQDMEEGTFTLISAGRFVPLKGFDLTIQAFASFLHGLTDQEKQRNELWLIGSGPEEHVLRALTKELRIADQVRFVSWMERTELMDRFRKSSAFIFPSHEGAGMVVAEALSFGLPVICLDNEGPGAFVNTECGFAIPRSEYHETVAHLSKAIKQLYINPDKRKQMRSAARKQFETFFHWDRRGDQLNKIYASL